MEQWMQLRFIVRESGHSAATIWASGTATLFVLFAAATGTALVSTRFAWHRIGFRLRARRSTHGNFDESHRDRAVVRHGSVDVQVHATRLSSLISIRSRCWMTSGERQIFSSLTTAAWAGLTATSACSICSTLNLDYQKFQVTRGDVPPTKPPASD